jgi:hypothetical protein
LDNPRLGEKSQVALMTEPSASTPDVTSEDAAVRDRQLACVIGYGGCTSTRDGGLAVGPGIVDIQTYNDQCKKDGTQYTGPDITPTDEECKNPPKEGVTTEDVLPGILVLAGGVAAGFLIVVAAPAIAAAAAEGAAAAAPAIVRVGATVLIRVAPALLPAVTGAEATAGAATVPALVVSAESAPSAVQGAGLAARGVQVLRVVVQAAPAVTQATQAAAPATTIVASSTASSIPQALAILSIGLTSDSPTGPTQPDEEPQCSPTGFTEADAIPIVWFKPRIDNYYPKEIHLAGTTFGRDNPPSYLPTEPVPIGVEQEYWPFPGKVVQPLPVPRGPTADQFRAVLERNGFDWEGLEADHVQDLQFNGPDDFSNLWPLDKNANWVANNETQNQPITLCVNPTDPAPGTGTFAQAKKFVPNFFGRYLRIASVTIS